MATDPNSDLSRALEALSIALIWRAAGLRGQAPARDGVMLSPFREDKRPSFSVFGGGKRFRDHASEEAGGTWGFAALAWPNDSKAELADRLITLSGVPRTPRSAPGAGGSMMSTKERAVARRIAAARERTAAEQRLQKEVAAALGPRVEAVTVPRWPDFVADRWEEGIQCALADRGRIHKLAADRGWPDEWAEQLATSGKLATPWLPWCEPGHGQPKRGRACIVEMPMLAAAGDGAVSGLRPVGYHQRFWMDQQKQWVYVPHRPKRDGAGFVGQMVEYAKGQPEDRSLVPGLPFMLGSLEPDWVVISEGQWDAITIAGAVGFFEDCWARKVAFFGVRGVAGVEVLLAYWSAWLARWKPRVWLLCDADKAGLKWINRPKSAAPGTMAIPTLAERLRAAGAAAVKVSVLKAAVAEEHGKDFNDWYRSVRPDRASIELWLQREGVLC